MIEVIEWHPYLRLQFRNNEHLSRRTHFAIDDEEERGSHISRRCFSQGTDTFDELRVLRIACEQRSRTHG